MPKIIVYEMKSTKEYEIESTSRGMSTDESDDMMIPVSTRMERSRLGRLSQNPNRPSIVPILGSRDNLQSTSRANTSRARLDIKTPSTYTLDREVKQYMEREESTEYEFYPGTETLVYEYIEERNDMNATNLIESIAHLIKGSLGAGVLCMHEAYMYGGLWTSLGCTFIVGILVSHSMLMLASSAQSLYGKIRMTKLSYPDLAEVAAATGPWKCFRKRSKMFRYTVDLCLFLQMCGTCCIYQIMIAHTLKQVLESLSTSIAEARLTLRIYILIVTPILLLLCMIRSLKFLAPFSMLSDIFVAMCVLTTLYYTIRIVDDINQRRAWNDVHGFIRFIGICMYCTCGIAVVLPIENNMRKPKSFRVAVQYAMIVVVLFTSMTGFFGYWGWGEDSRSPITVHMPINVFTTILQFLLVMMLSTTFAVQFWVPFRIVWHYAERKYKRQATWERLYRLVMATFVSGMSIAFPNLIPVMIFIGQFLMGFVAFVFPALIDHLVAFGACYREEGKLWRLFQNTFLIILGLFLSVSAFYSLRPTPLIEVF